MKRFGTVTAARPPARTHAHTHETKRFPGCGAHASPPSLRYIYIYIYTVLNSKKIVVRTSRRLCGRLCGALVRTSNFPDHCLCALVRGSLGATSWHRQFREPYACACLCAGAVFEFWLVPACAVFCSVDYLFCSI